jgi:hypothetical protein
MTTWLMARVMSKKYKIHTSHHLYIEEHAQTRGRAFLHGKVMNKHTSTAIKDSPKP